MRTKSDAHRPPPPPLRDVDTSDPSSFVQGVLNRLAARRMLSELDAERMMEMILSDQIELDSLVSYLRLLSDKGLSVGEIVGSARALRRVTRRLVDFGEALDNCGTGGDGKSTFNISTAAALLISAAGQPVVKHGNRSSSGGVGSADLMETLGLRLNLNEAELRESFRKHHFAFLFAPRFRPAATRIREARLRIGGPTLFNLLGPLCNPAAPAFQVIGTFDEDTARKIAQALLRLGTRRTFVVVGPGGLDEVIPQEGNIALDVRGRRISRLEFGARAFGLRPCLVGDLKGGDASENARMVRRIFMGERGAPRDAVLMNAGLGLFTTGRAATLRDGLNMAAAAIDRDAAAALLDALQKEAAMGTKTP